MTVAATGITAMIEAAVSDWEDPPRRPPPGAVPMLAAAGFAGPLDWLLEMARAGKIDLAKLSIAALIGSFAMALEAALARRDGAFAARLGRWGDWTVMAAALTELRSRLLLPADAPQARAAANEAEALRRQLIDRGQMDAAADWLDRQSQLGQDLFVRGRPEASPAGGVGGAGQGCLGGSRWHAGVGDITELLSACLVALRVPAEQAAAYRPRPPPLWMVSDAIARVKTLLPVLPDDSLLVAFVPKIGLAEPDRNLRCKAAVASTLMAGLERARTGDLRLAQEAIWKPIRLRRPSALPASDSVDPVA